MTDLKLRLYQQEDVAKLVERRRAYVAHKPGLGKTAITLAATERLGQLPCLILSPTVALYVWYDEIHKWLGKHRQAKAMVYMGTPSERAKLFNRFTENSMEFLITTYAKAKELEGRAPWRTLVCDEIHLAGLLNRKSQTYAAVERLARAAPAVFLLTGTPIRHNIADLWPPLHILYPEVFRSYWSFVNKYCITIKDRFGVTIEARPKDLDEARRLIETYLVWRRKEDVLRDLPEKNRQVIRLDMTPKQRKAYEQLSSEMILEAGNELIVAPSTLAKMTRLRQLCVCPQILGLDDPGASVGALPELVDAQLQAGYPVVVFTPFKAALPLIARHLRSSLKEINDLKIYQVHGDLPARDREAQRKAFQHDPNPHRVLLCTIKSATSFGAYAAHTAFFVGYEWSAIDNIQAEDRLHRIGQQKPVTAYYLLLNGTIDEDVMEVLNDKTRAENWTLNSEAVLRAIKNFRCP